MLRSKFAAVTPASAAPTTAFGDQPRPEGMSAEEASYILPETQVPETGMDVRLPESGSSVRVPFQWKEQTEESALAQADAERARKDEARKQELADFFLKKRGEAEIGREFEKTPAEIEAEALARARGQRRGAPPVEGGSDDVVMVDKYDPKTGQTVRTPVLKSDLRAMAKTGQGFEKAPNTATANRMEAARSSIASGEQLLRELKDPKYAGAIGPIMGRYNSLAQAAGAGSPEAQYIVGALRSFAALQPQIHGFRSVQFTHDIEKLLTTKQTPETLAAGIQGILTASYIVSHGEPEGASDQGWTELEGGLRIREKR
jgi:hypothetical protein